jgi:hypothetical protein
VKKNRRPALPLFPFAFSLFITQSQGARRRYGRKKTVGKISICTVHDTKYMLEGMKDRPNLFHSFSPNLCSCSNYEGENAKCSSLPNKNKSYKLQHVMNNIYGDLDEIE